MQIVETQFSVPVDVEDIADQIRQAVMGTVVRDTGDISEAVLLEVSTQIQIELAGIKKKVQDEIDRVIRAHVQAVVTASMIREEVRLEMRSAARKAVKEALQQAKAEGE